MIRRSEQLIRLKEDRLKTEGKADRKIIYA